MKIAIAYEAGMVFQHFGHTAQFMICDVAGGQVRSSEILDSRASGHGALAELLRSWDVLALICGGIGSGARTALAQAGIAVYGGVTGDADEAAQSFADGVLLYDPNAKCTHHGESLSCGSCHR